MNKYEYFEGKGNPFVRINNKLFLIDTGCSVSIGFTCKEIIINDEVFKLQYNSLSMTKENMLFAFGSTIDGVIGEDIILHFKILEVDKTNHTVYFGYTVKKYKKEIHFNNDFIIQISINENKLNGFLDTGAARILVDDKKYLNLDSFVGNDIEPAWVSNIDVEKYKTNVEFNNVTIQTEVIYPLSSYYHKPNIHVYFGLSQISKEYYVFDFNKNILFFE